MESGLDPASQERNHVPMSAGAPSLPRRLARRLMLAWQLVRTVPQIFGRGGSLKIRVLRACRLLKREGLGGIQRALVQKQIRTPLRDEAGAFSRNDYAEWVRRYDTPDDGARARVTKRIDAMKSRPRISIVMPVYDPPLAFLEKAVRSVRRQSYPHWELCIADDASTNQAVRDLLSRHAVEDDRIKLVFRKVNGHIAQASNSALQLVTGDYIALLDDDDVLAEHALFWVADAINRHPDAALIYSDTDKLSVADERSTPYFKCDWNETLFLSHNFLAHLTVYRASLVQALGGFRTGYEGAQDYDLALRAVESVRPAQIVHVPRILYHWRAHRGSTASGIAEKPYALAAGEKALNEHFARRGTPARAEALGRTGVYRVRYSVPDPAPLVSILIPTRDRNDLVLECVDSIYNLTSYRNFEIILIDNNTQDSGLAGLAGKRAWLRVLRDDRPFNYSGLNNRAAAAAAGGVLVLLNNDTEVIAPDWLTEMVSLVAREDVGAVGAKLLYPNDTVQHAGMILGIGGKAGHAHRGLAGDNMGYGYRAAVAGECSSVTGACLAVKKQDYFRVGGLNESELSTTFNDVDLCLKLKEAGLKVIFTPWALLYHHESLTRGYDDTPEQLERFEREAAYAKSRWRAWLENDPAYNPNLTLDSEDFSFAWPPRVDPY